MFLKLIVKFLCEEFVSLELLMYQRSQTGPVQATWRLARVEILLKVLAEEALYSSLQFGSLSCIELLENACFEALNEEHTYLLLRQRFCL